MLWFLKNKKEKEKERPMLLSVLQVLPNLQFNIKKVEKKNTRLGCLDTSPASQKKKKQ